MATHFIPPGIAGYDEAGGAKGFGLDFLSADGAPQPAVSAKYFKAAGYPSGKYTGTEKILMVGDNTGVAAKTAQVAAQQLKNMGFNITLRLVEHATMYTRYCNTPSAKVQICPNVGWLKDFPDPETFLNPTFNGDHILQTGNANWSQLDDRTLNERMRHATVLTDPMQRARAWADIDEEITRLAAAIPWLWPKQANIRSENVVGTIDEDNATWSLAHTRIR
jgi:peptide/nickel transport system substrate-binding protein